MSTKTAVKPADPAKIERILKEAKVLVHDVETEGLDWRVHKSVGYVLTWGVAPDETAYLPFNHGGGGNLPWDPRKMYRKIMAQRQDVLHVFFNAAFDLRFYSSDDVEFAARLEDAQVNAFLIDEYQPGGFSLDASCKAARVQEKKGDDLYRHLADLFSGEPTRRAQMGNYWKLAGNDPIGSDYAGGDGTSTFALWQRQQRDLDNFEGLRKIWDIECRLTKTLHRMTWRGIKIDEERLDTVGKLIRSQRATLAKQLPKDFNTRAPSQMKKLFTDAKIIDWPMTAPSKNFPQGQPSYPEEWLMKSPLGRVVVANRKMRHLDDSFYTPMVERHMYKGRVHCQFNQTLGEELGTLTGRLSCSDPNLQQVHKRNVQLGSIFRSIFAADLGMLWGSADYNQCEPRLLAHYGQVKVLLEGYLASPPIDAHSAVAKAAGIDRDSGKRLNQALITGAGDRKAAMMLQRSPTESDKIVRDYFAAMPEIKPFQRKVADIWKIRPLRSLLGRVVHLNDYNFAYKGVNRLLQCGNADVVKKAMVEVDEYFASEGDQTHLINSVHDQCDAQFHPDNRKQYERMIEIMEDFGPGKSVHLDVPLPVDAKIGRNWAEATYGIDLVQKSWFEMGQTYDPKYVRPALELKS